MRKTPDWRHAISCGVDCRDCLRDIDHCHGTLIVHSSRHAECTDRDCDSQYVLRHSLVIDCIAAQCDCASESQLAV
ncbi:hypothetical protein [Mycobacteroides abscessus]|uniref:hypothetical protein n=1 Tax=Mycobacteroides abscessus TaxID=36809 RepID=UPI0005EA527A|nr:hypothetical protein [Mycobacteroides abscessus]MBN7301094.1 hypothetical protein [Mycobacteroides abscessus subsp. bolletii]RIT93380.1 hypothetical protein D2F00_21520 [Mycobacteroides abscessus]CPW65192.1 Uncharacterised protein [Mycobacteroides abscessus]SKF35288.1 Uncharacterised protein [Mycobacteroides abscessus subsp. bolletii]SKG78129.1 Uncharacterised protein [Mycobacteroides abscessus subsp. bolletii]